MIEKIKDKTYWAAALCQIYFLLSTTWSVSLALKMKDKLHLKYQVSTLHLCPARLPQNADKNLQNVAAELPFDLLNPPKLGSKGFIVEGDIVMNKEQYQVLQASAEYMFRSDNGTKTHTARKAVPLRRYLWPASDQTGMPIVPYTIASAVSRTAVAKAMKAWEDATCVLFKPASIFRKPYVKIIKSRGCWSYVGMTGVAGQRLSIGESCNRHGIILHELGHALGLFHEQSRSDRNEYIKVNYQNLKPKSEVNFVLEETNNYGVPYDFGSIMHYGPQAYSKNGKSTIVTIDPDMQIFLGQRKSLSFRDIAIVNKMYKCEDLWKKSCSSVPSCLNGGYLGKNCGCVCPPGTEGNSCQTVKGSYYTRPATQICGGNITKEGTVITSKNYPKHYPADSRCAWWIQSDDPCKSPAVVVEDFELFVRIANNQCIMDRLEVRTDSLYNGKEYCDKDLKKNMIIEGSGRDLLLLFTSKLRWGRGFKFTVKFVDRCLKCKTTTSSTAVQWQSPQYPSLYPNNHHCHLTVEKNIPSRTYLRFIKLNLPTNCHDHISIRSAFNMNYKICGVRRGSAQLIGSQHTANFISDSHTGTQGWSLSFVSVRSSCHKNVQLTSSQRSGILTSPRYPRNHPRNALCEWWFEAPQGHNILLTFHVLRLATSAYFPSKRWFRRAYYQKRCHLGYILISKTGDKEYKSVNGSQKICGYRNNGFKVKSTGNKMSLLFFGAKKRTMGMKVAYSLA